MHQYPFRFQHHTEFLREDFILSPANEVVFSYLEQWPLWGEQRFSRILYIHGPKGSGKSHLASLWQQRAQALFVSPASIDIAPPIFSHFPGCYILEDLETIIPPPGQENILHLLNSAVEGKHYLLLTSVLPPSQLPVTLADLSSRLKAVPSLGITAPDDLLLQALLAKHFSDKQLRIDPDVLSYLVTRIERSFTSALAVAEYIDNEALVKKRNITIPFVRELLHNPNFS